MLEDAALEGGKIPGPKPLVKDVKRDDQLDSELAIAAKKALLASKVSRGRGRGRGGRGRSGAPSSPKAAPRRAGGRGRGDAAFPPGPPPDDAGHGCSSSSSSGDGGVYSPTSAGSAD